MPNSAKKYLNVQIPHYLWDELKLDDPDMYERALCAFYMNMGVEGVTQLATASQDDPRVKDLLRVAPLLGLTKQDRITKSN